MYQVIRATIAGQPVDTTQHVLLWTTKGQDGWTRCRGHLSGPDGHQPRAQAINLYDAPWQDDSAELAELAEVSVDDECVRWPDPQAGGLWPGISPDILQSVHHPCLSCRMTGLLVFSSNLTL